MRVPACWRAWHVQGLATHAKAKPVTVRVHRRGWHLTASTHAATKTWLLKISQCGARLLQQTPKELTGVVECAATYFGFTLSTYPRVHLRWLIKCLSAPRALWRA